MIDEQTFWKAVVSAIGLATSAAFAWVKLEFVRQDEAREAEAKKAEANRIKDKQELDKDIRKNDERHREQIELLTKMISQQDASLLEYRDKAEDRALKIELVIQKLDSFGATLKNHMAEEVIEDAKLNETLKQLTSNVHKIELEIAAMPKRKGD